jgi:hypothetical protein
LAKEMRLDLRVVPVAVRAAKRCPFHGSLWEWRPPPHIPPPGREECI